MLCDMKARGKVNQISETSHTERQQTLLTLHLSYLGAKLLLEFGINIVSWIQLQTVVFFFQSSPRLN